MNSSENKIEIKSELASGYKHIHLLNGLSLARIDTLYKYMPYDRLMNCVANGELVFVSPVTWVDPFERRFWKTDYSRKYNFIRPEIACMCLTTKSSTNEEAAWRMYAEGKSKALRISFNVKRLLDTLESYVQTNHCAIYIGEAIYSLERKAIVGLHNQVNEFFPKNNFSLEHYLTLMCLKRKAFAFENEIRIFIVNNNNTWNSDIIKIPVKIDKNLIPRIMIGPLTPFANSDPRKNLYNTIQNVERDVYKQRLIEKIQGCDVKQSQLYTDKSPLKRI